MSSSDLDIGVVYTHERELMSRLLGTMLASGQGLQMRLIGMPLVVCPVRLY